VIDRFSHGVILAEVARDVKRLRGGGRSLRAGGDLPAYAPWFRLGRYAAPAYQALLHNWRATGQL